MKGVYRFYWDCGRMGKIKSIFTAEKEEIDAILGKQAYFGEVLGKHSEIHGVIESADFTLLTTDELAVEMFEKYQMETGLNPFDYID